MRMTIIALALFASIQAHAALCPTWEQPTTVGKIDTSAMPEASGLAISKTHPGRLYHINDKGNSPTVYVTDKAGKISQQFEISLANTATADTESLGYGPCAAKTCLFIGDIGDNNSSRTSIQLAWLEEKATYSPSEKLTGQISMTYPDGAQNAEGFFIDSKGDFVVFTKNLVKEPRKPGEKGKKKTHAGPSSIYRLAAAKLATGKGSFTLEKLGEIDVPALLGAADREALVTGASHSNDGRVLLLTYKAAVELAWKPGDTLKSTSQMKRGTDYNVIDLALPQQEAIEFSPDGKSFLVTSERGTTETPIVEVKCKL